MFIAAIRVIWAAGRAGLLLLEPRTTILESGDGHTLSAIKIRLKVYFAQCSLGGAGLTSTLVYMASRVHMYRVFESRKG